jgi:hypothetical protein
LPRLKRSPSLPIAIGTPHREEKERAIYVMNIKQKISKKLVMRLALFVAVIGMASLFDIYFDNNQVKPEESETGSAKKESKQEKIILISQSVNLDLKTPVQKTVVRKLQVKSQDKLNQKYYQLRNYQVLKAEVQTQTTPLINTYHYLAFKNYFYSIPDDIPLIA